MVSRRMPGVLPAKDLAALRLGHHHLAKVLEWLWIVVAYHVEAIGRILLQPGFQFIRDMVRGPDQYAITHRGGGAARNL